MYVCFWLTILDNINLEIYDRNWQFLKISELGICSFDLKLDKLSSIFKKEATVSDLLSPLFKKKWSWANWSRRFKKKSACDQIALVTLQKSYREQIPLNRFAKKPHIFCRFLTVFPPLYANRANWSRRSLLSCSLLKMDGIDSLSSLFTKGRPWGNCSP